MTKFLKALAAVFVIVMALAAPVTAVGGEAPKECSDLSDCEVERLWTAIDRVNSDLRMIQERPEIDPATYVGIEAHRRDLRALKARFTGDLAAYKREVAAQFGEIDRFLTALAGRVEVLEGQVAGILGRLDKVEADIGALQTVTQGHTEDISALTVRVAALEQSERDWREGFILGGAITYSGGVGGEVQEYGIFFEDESQYATNRATFSPYAGIVAEYRQRLYTDLTGGFVLDATNNGGIGFEIRGHIGYLMAQRKLVVGAGAFIRWTKAGGGKGGTFGVTSTDPGASVFIKYALWRSKMEGAQINLGGEVGLAGITQSILADRLQGTTMEARGFLELRLGKTRPPEVVEE